MFLIHKEAVEKFPGAIIHSGALIHSGARIHSGAIIHSGALIKRISNEIIFAESITFLYEYKIMIIIDSKHEIYIGMGCYQRKKVEWEKDFWNNPGEFPNDNSTKSQDRKRAFKIVCKLADIYIERLKIK